MPEAGYELRPIAVEGLSRTNPLKAARARAEGGAAPSARRAGSSASVRPDAVLGGGGYVAGPVGSRCGARAGAARADRGRQPPRADQPAARALGAARVPGLPDRGPRRRALPASPGARCRRRRPTASRARAALRPRRGRHLRARLRRLARRALDQRGGGRRPSRDAPLPRAARLRTPRPRGAARALGPGPRPTTTCASTSRPSARRSRPPTCASRAPAARSSRSPRTGARPSSCPTRTRRPTTRARTRAGWPTAGAAVVVARRRADARAAGERGRRPLLGDPARLAAMAGRRRRWRGRRPLSGSPTRCSPRRAEGRRRRRAR